MPFTVEHATVRLWIIEYMLSLRLTFGTEHYEHLTPHVTSSFDAATLTTESRVVQRFENRGKWL